MCVEDDEMPDMDQVCCGVLQFVASVLQFVAVCDDDEDDKDDVDDVMPDMDRVCCSVS